MNNKEFIELCNCGETSRVQFKQEFTSQVKIAQEMVAFANSHGGVILFGVEDKKGTLVGLTYHQLQQISHELGNTASEQVKPIIYIETEVVRVEEEYFLVCHIEEGRNKPYKTNNGEIWVKQGADKRRVTENSEILSLFQDSGNYHAEEQRVSGSSVSDLEIAYLREYFQSVYGKAIEDFNQPLEVMLRSIGVIASNGEMTRAGNLFFGKKPQQYEHSFKIKAVAFVGSSIGGKEYIDSRDIVGTLPMMFRDGMAFLRSMLRHKQNGQNFNSVGVLEIPDVVLEELLQNALIHIDLLHPAAVRVLVFENRIEIINPGRLYGGLRVQDIMLGASKQRNPLMADFAERTMIYRGLGSGIVRVMRENVQIDFINEEEANQFRVIIWRTRQKESFDLSTIEVATQDVEKIASLNEKVASHDEKIASLDNKVSSLDEKVATHKKMSINELKNLIINICTDWVELAVIAKKSGRTYSYLRNKIIPKMLKDKDIEMMYPDAPNHPKQRYKRIR
ncbi:MAG: putative DNA binding domain-containing protein [Marinilabiliaceae bacterium]|nr:putative DNA binding domain-containing protein [Marinilabiliaceae bacterium]